MSAAALKRMTEEKAIAVVVKAGFTVTKVTESENTHAYAVVDPHGVCKKFSPSELRRTAWLWS